MGSKPKILIVGPDRRCKGGVVSVVNQYFDSDLNNYADLRYVATATEGGLIRKIIFFLHGLIGLLKSLYGVDLLHVHMASRSSYRRKRIIILVGKKIFKKKIIIHLHGGEFKKFYECESSRHQQKQIRDTFVLADAVIALSVEWKKFLCDFVSTEKIIIINNAVPIGMPTDTFHNKNILYLGRLNKRKGVYDLLDCVKDLSYHFPDIHFYLAGDGEVDECKEQCKEDNIEKNVTICGWIGKEEREDLFSKCGIFVLPSYNEGLPMAMLEAMAHQLEVIVTNVGGIPSVIIHKKNGILLNPGDKNSLIKAIERAYLNDKERYEIALRSREEIISNYSLENHLKKIFALYEAVIGENNNGGTSNNEKSINIFK